MALSLAPEKLPLTRDSDGAVRVGGTRVTLDTIVDAFLAGATAEDIVQQYPSLDLADIYLIISYFLRHRGEVECYLQDRQAQCAEVRQLNESRFDPAGVRDRLIARRTVSETKPDASADCG